MAEPAAKDVAPASDPPVPAPAPAPAVAAPTAPAAAADASHQTAANATPVAAAELATPSEAAGPGPDPAPAPVSEAPAAVRAVAAPADADAVAVAKPASSIAPTTIAATEATAGETRCDIPRCHHPRLSTAWLDGRLTPGHTPHPPHALTTPKGEKRNRLVLFQSRKIEYLYTVSGFRRAGRATLRAAEGRNPPAEPTAGQSTVSRPPLSHTPAPSPRERAAQTVKFKTAVPNNRT